LGKINLNLRFENVHLWEDFEAQGPLHVPDITGGAEVVDSEPMLGNGSCYVVIIVGVVDHL